MSHASAIPRGCCVLCGEPLPAGQAPALETCPECIELDIDPAQAVCLALDEGRLDCPRVCPACRRLYTEDPFFRRLTQKVLLPIAEADTPLLEELAGLLLEELKRRLIVPEGVGVDWSPWDVNPAGGSTCLTLTATSETHFLPAIVLHQGYYWPGSERNANLARSMDQWAAEAQRRLDTWVALDSTVPAAKLLEKPLTGAELRARAAEDGYVEGVVSLSLSELLDLNLEGFLNVLSEKLVGDELLMDTTYNVAGCDPKNDELWIRVSGDPSAVLSCQEDGSDA